MSKHDTYCFSRESSVSTAPWRSGLRRTATTHMRQPSGGTRRGRCLWVWMSTGSHWEGRKPAGRTRQPTSFQLWCELENLTGEGGYAALDREVFNTEKAVKKIKTFTEKSLIWEQGTNTVTQKCCLCSWLWLRSCILFGRWYLCCLWHGMYYLSFFLCQTVCNQSMWWQHRDAEVSQDVIYNVYYPVRHQMICNIKKET